MMKQQQTGLLRRLLRRLRGLGHSRGFGVQSPSDYRFVREVVCERWPYYAYGDMQEFFPDLQAERLRLCRFYLRLANMMQPDVVLMSHADLAVREYVAAGCRKARFVDTGAPAVGFRLAWVSASDCTPSLAEALLKGAASGSAIVVEGIWRKPSAAKFWQQLVADDAATVAFDLYGCGIVFFLPKRHKCLYRVNA